MSTAWYKPNRIPKRIRSWITSSSSTSSSLPTLTPLQSLPTSALQLQQQQHHKHSRSIEVWDTTCIVTNMNYSPPPSPKNDTSSSNNSNNENNDNSNNDNNNNSNSNNNNDKFSILINPGNPSLSGVSKFSYFPVGGPEPSDSYSNVNNDDHKDSHPIMGYVTQWGGMDVGNGMMFASNTIDGLVHQYGGTLLKLECQRVLTSMENMKMKTKMKTKSQQKRRINEGTAIQTNVVGQKLIDISGYQKLIHTVPPFFHHHNHKPKNKNNNDIDSNVDNDDNDDNDEINVDVDVDFLLAECYRNSLNVAIRRSSSSTSSSLSSPNNNDDSSNNLRIACPLLGAGCRGFPIDRAIKIAAKATIEWMMMIKKKKKTPITTTITTTGTDTDTNTDDVTDKVITDKNDTMKQMSSLPSSSSWWWSPWRWFGGRRKEEEGTNDDSYEYKQPHSVTIAFGIPDGEIRTRLIEAIDQEMEKEERKHPHNNDDVYNTIQQNKIRYNKIK